MGIAVASYEGPISPGGSGRLPLPCSTTGLASEHPTALLQNSVSAVTWNCHGLRRPAVWLIGDSYIHCAAQQASARPCGLNLGFTNADLSWRGIQGLKWMQVLSEVVSISKPIKTPTVLVIHAGANDLCSVPMAGLISLICSDFDRFTTFFADLVVVWSEVIPRLWWYGARNQTSMERARRTLNMRVSRHVRSKGGVVVRHRLLEGDNRELMQQDGILLNDNGLDIFLSGLQDAVERALILLLGQSSK